MIWCESWVLFFGKKTSLFSRVLREWFRLPMGICFECNRYFLLFKDFDKDTIQKSVKEKNEANFNKFSSNCGELVNTNLFKLIINIIIICKIYLIYDFQFSLRHIRESVWILFSHAIYSCMYNILCYLHFSISFHHIFIALLNRNGGEAYSHALKVKVSGK